MLFCKSTRLREGLGILAMLTKHIITSATFSLLIMAASVPAHAGGATPLEEARILYSSGDFAKATNVANAVLHPADLADAYSLACKSQLILGGFKSAGQKSVSALHSAIEYCHRALQQDPKHFEARFNLAVALGFEGRRVRGASYATRSRAEIETLIAQYPNNPIALGALAGWHSEAAKEGFLARTFLGASRKKARNLFRSALENSQDIALSYEYVRFLSAGKKAERDEALRFGQAFMNQHAGKVPPTSFEAMLLERAATLLAALKSEDKQQTSKALLDVAAFPDIKDYDGMLPKYPLPPEIDLISP